MILHKSGHAAPLSFPIMLPPAVWARESAVRQSKPEGTGCGNCSGGGGGRIARGVIQ
jgi:hypothetical protein